MSPADAEALAECMLLAATVVKPKSDRWEAEEHAAAGWGELKESWDH
jgi:hypothetical protein